MAIGKVNVSGGASQIDNMKLGSPPTIVINSGTSLDSSVSCIDKDDFLRVFVGTVCKKYNSTNFTFISEFSLANVSGTPTCIDYDYTTDIAYVYYASSNKIIAVNLTTNVLLWSNYTYLADRI